MHLNGLDPVYPPPPSFWNIHVPFDICRILSNIQCKKSQVGNYSVFHRIYNRLDVHFQLCGKLLVKCQLDPLNVVAQLDGWSQLQIHALLYRWQVQQQQCLSIDLLNKTNKQKSLWEATSENVNMTPLQVKLCRCLLDPGKSVQEVHSQWSWWSAPRP